MKAIEVITTPWGKTCLDFGQNLVGWVRIEKDFEADGELKIRCAEVLEHGELGTRPLRTAKATDTITLGVKTLGVKTLGVKTLGVKTLGVKTLGVKTLGVKTLGVKTLGVKTLGVKTLG